MKTASGLPYRVEEEANLWVPMADGVRLAARVWRPVCDHPVPAIFEYVPYRKRFGTASRDEGMHGWLAGHGYACLRVDLRGSGESEAVPTDAYLQLELDDGCAVLVWMQDSVPPTTGLFAGKWCAYADGPDLAHDQRQEDGGAEVFESDPLIEPLEILGAVAVELDLTVDQPVAMVAARLSDVAPDDKATRVTCGLLNLTHRDSSEAPAPLEPGRRYRVRVRLNGIAQHFPAGHRLRLSLSTSYWPLAWPPPRPVRLSLHTEGCRLLLPVRAPQPGDERLRAFRTASRISPTELHPPNRGHLSPFLAMCDQGVHTSEPAREPISREPYGETSAVLATAWH